MILLLASLGTLACVLVSAARLRFVIEATPLDPARLHSGLAMAVRNGGGSASIDALAEAVGTGPQLEWERDILRGFRSGSANAPALLGEAMTELDFKLRRWLRVPRVCASLGTSFAFLLATIALRIGLSDLVGTLDPDRVVSVNDAVLQAVDVAAVGLVAAAFCIAIQVQARASLKARREASDDLVELLGQLADRDGAALAGDLHHASVRSPEGSGELQHALVVHT
jgi:hypothetical protein